MYRLLPNIVSILIAGILLVFAVGKGTAGLLMPDTPSHTQSLRVNPSSYLDLIPGLIKADSAFIDQLAADTWNYLSSSWATANHLPWSWRSEVLTGGDYANPAEIGFFALAWLAAYDFQSPWSPTWEQTEAQVTAILDQLRVWQTGSQTAQPYGPNAYRSSLFYQWYWISDNPPVVGPGLTDQLVPSIDNAWLAASLITLREYGAAHNHPELSRKADAILEDMDFTHWYDPVTHRFFLGGTQDPQGGSAADNYSNENRIINFIARALGQLSKDEFQLSLEALERPSAAYDGIVVEATAWDGSYFTYTTPALFIRELDTDYGRDTIIPATQAQIAYAQEQDYGAWGLSDCFGAGEGGYVQQGALPVVMPGSPETNPGLVAPYASALGLITPLSPQSVANLQTLADTLSCAYHPDYGFRDSLVVDPSSPDYGSCSHRFSALAQEWIFLSIANYRNHFIWDYFYRDDRVVATHREMFADYQLYLPVALTPKPPLMVADFDGCTSLNNLGGQMGAAFNPPDRLVEEYITEPDRGCIARLSYQVVHWSTFWLKLPGLDLTYTGRLVFDIRSAQPGLPAEFKIELKRGNEVSHLYLSGVGDEWQTVQVNLADFSPTPYAPPLSSWLGMEELDFTFEADRSGSQGVIYLDNVAFWEGVQH